jgi:hypothetical protein
MTNVLSQPLMVLSAAATLFIFRISRFKFGENAGGQTIIDQIIGEIPNVPRTPPGHATLPRLARGRLTGSGFLALPLCLHVAERRVSALARVSTDDKGQDPENQLRELRDWVINSGPRSLQRNHCGLADSRCRSRAGADSSSVPAARGGHRRLRIQISRVNPKGSPGLPIC